MARNKHRTAGPIRRATPVPVSRNLTVGTSPAHRNPTVVSAPGPVRRTPKAKMTGAQRDSTGARSMWNDPTDFYTDPRWSDPLNTVCH